MSDFWRLLEQSVITQAVITLLAVAVTCFLWVEGRTVPPELYTLDSLVIGFYFGSKMGFHQGVAKSSASASVPPVIVAPPSPQ